MTYYRFGEVSSMSTEYVQVDVEARHNGRPHNLSTTAVWFAFVPEGIDPGPGNWVPGSWEVLNRTYVAQCLIGPGGNPVAEGDWVVWVRVIANPEVPVRPVGLLRVT